MGYCTSLMKHAFIYLSTSSSTFIARFDWISLGACFKGHLSNSVAKRYITATISKSGISEYVHAKTSRFCFRNSMYIPFSYGDIFRLKKVGSGSSSKPRSTPCSSSKVFFPVFSNSGGAFLGGHIRFLHYHDRLRRPFVVPREHLTVRWKSWWLGAYTLTLSRLWASLLRYWELFFVLASTSLQKVGFYRSSLTYGRP